MLDGYDYEASYSPEDNKLRLRSTGRLPEDIYKRVKAHGFKWAPKQDLFVAPMWTPQREDLLLELCGEIGDEDTSLVERAEQRAERFEGYSESRAEDYQRARDGVSAIADNIPLGQPILVGHHSERHARKDAERIENGMRKAVKMWETSRYWEQRAAGALAHAKYKELPRVRANRIKTIEADKRKQERNKKEAENWLKFWDHDGKELDVELARRMAGHSSGGWLPCIKREDGTYWDAYDVLKPDGERYDACPSMTVAEVQEVARRVYPRQIAWADRWINHLNNRLIYEKAMLEEQGKSDLIAPKPRPEQLPLLNYRIPDPGITLKSRYSRGTMEVWPQVEMTKAEYAKLYEDYKGTRIIDGTHRIRIALIHEPGKEYFHRTQNSVFLTDSKEHKRPEPRSEEEKAKAEEKILAAHTEREEKEDQERTSLYKPYEPSPEEKEVEALRESLKTGVKVVSAPQLFATPREKAEYMVELLEPRAGHRTLEPSAGTGRLLDALDAVPGLNVVAIELSYSLVDALKARSNTKHDIRQGDFLDCTVEELGTFDRIIMNPPFVNGADIKHIKHAMTFLKPGGRLVALCANGPRQQDTLMPIAHYWEDLPAGSFKEAGTNVNVALLVIVNGEEEEDEPEPVKIEAKPIPVQQAMADKPQQLTLF